MDTSEVQLEPGASPVKDSGSSKIQTTIFISGSRGEVQPYIALAKALEKNGSFSVRIATERRVQKLVEEEFQLPFVSLEGDPTGLLFEEEAKDILAKGSLFKLIKLTEKWDQKFNKRDILNSYFEAGKGSQLIIGANLTLTASYCVAEKIGAVWVPMILGPTMPTSEFPLWAMAGLLGCFPCLNKWSYSVAFKSLWNQEKKFINPWRKEVLELEEIKDAPRGLVDILEDKKPPILIAYSPLLTKNAQVPKDYPSHVHLSGFLFVPSKEKDEQVDANVVDFLSNAQQNNKKIIYMGFGSMPSSDPTQLAQWAVDITKKITPECCVILCTGWSNLEAQETQQVLQPCIDNKSILVVKSIPHAWLFPQVDCIVHHCGLGTLAAAFRSGKPQVPCPIMLDQPYNAQMIVRSGCAPGSISYQTLQKNPSPLFALIQKALEDTGILSKAKEFGQKITTESQDLDTKFVQIIEQYYQEETTK